MLELPVRKTPRLSRLNYLGQTLYFVTFCCFRRARIFSDAERCEWLLGLLRSESAANSFNIPAYCLMPDHLHFLAEGTKPSSDLRHFVKSLKIKSSRQYSAQFGRILWQKGFHEHILRSTESVQSVAWYIWLNPVRKGLLAKPHDYPHLGSFTGLELPSAWNSLDWCPPWKRTRGPRVDRR
jgi:putative transposase